MLGDKRVGRKRSIPPKLYRIGEIVDYAGLSRQTIHNYTTMGLLHESRWTRGGHRLYDESVFERLDQVIEMKRRNKSMREIREHFSRVDQGRR
ncbi:MAG: MerR family transcriptional regulator [Planctomycetota bacterium]